MTTLYADPLALHERMMLRVQVQADGCWIFTGCTNSRGYGCVAAGAKGKTVLAHRLAVIVRDGAIPAGMTVDHLCHNSDTCRLDAECTHRRCVNPDHLAVVTIGQNTARRWESGKCQLGHELAYRKRGNGKARYCPTCQADYQRDWRERQHPTTSVTTPTPADPSATGGGTPHP